MMKVVRDWTALMGKTIEKVEELDDDMVLVFNDDTYTVIHSGPSYDWDRSAPELETLDLPSAHTSEHHALALAQLGIWDNDEYVKWQGLREVRNQNNKAETERRERATLAALKAKYEAS